MLPKRPLGLTKPKKLNSDSLMKESNRKKAIANVQEKIGSSLVKKGLGDKKKTYWDSEGSIGIGKQKTIPTGKERLEIAKKLRESAKKDSLMSVKNKK